MSWLRNRITLHSHDSPPEELASALTHAVGAALAVIATVVLRGTPGGLVFGLSMVLLFSASTAYHLAPPGDWKRLFRLMDHLSIFVLIAGTYTPIMLHVAQPWSFRTLWLVWLLAATGMTLKAFLWDRFSKLQILFFLGMGWLAVWRLPQLLQILPAAFLWYMLAGGLSYTLGVGVYSLKKMPYYHAIWHLFVLAGAISFFHGINAHMPV